MTTPEPTPGFKRNNPGCQCCEEEVNCCDPENCPDEIELEAFDSQDSSLGVLILTRTTCQRPDILDCCRPTIEFQRPVAGQSPIGEPCYPFLPGEGTNDAHYGCFWEYAGELADLFGKTLPCYKDQMYVTYTVCNYNKIVQVHGCIATGEPYIDPFGDPNELITPSRRTAWATFRSTDAGQDVCTEQWTEFNLPFVKDAECLYVQFGEGGFGGYGPCWQQCDRLELTDCHTPGGGFFGACYLHNCLGVNSPCDPPPPPDPAASCPIYGLTNFDIKEVKVRPVAAP